MSTTWAIVIGMTVLSLILGRILLVAASGTRLERGDSLEKLRRSYITWVFGGILLATIAIWLAALALALTVT